MNFPPMNFVEFVLIVIVAMFFIITAIALIYSSKKRGMEILLKKPFFKENPDDIKNKVLKEL